MTFPLGKTAMQVRGITALHYAVILTAALCVGACASGARMSGMLVPVQESTLISDESPLYQAIYVEVSGGEETSPFWISKVSNGAFQDALENTLALHTLLAENTPPRFELSAELVDLEQPWVGISMTVVATIRYRLTDLSTASVVLDEQVVTPYTSEFTAALSANERIRLATEGAMRNSMEVLIRELVVAFAPDRDQVPGRR